MSRVVVVGVCMQPDVIHPATAINKEIELRFVLGYDPGEFRDTLHMIADGTVDPSPLVTGTVGLDSIDAAFGALASPTTTPRSSSTPAAPPPHLIRGLRAVPRDAGQRGGRGSLSVSSRPSALRAAVRHAVAVT